MAMAIVPFEPRPGPGPQAGSGDGKGEGLCISTSGHYPTNGYVVCPPSVWRLVATCMQPILQNTTFPARLYVTQQACMIPGLASTCVYFGAKLLRQLLHSCACKYQPNRPRIFSTTRRVSVTFFVGRWPTWSLHAVSAGSWLDHIKQWM